jgi:hypothetical protein
VRRRFWQEAGRVIWGYFSDIRLVAARVRVGGLPSRPFGGPAAWGESGDEPRWRGVLASASTGGWLGCQGRPAAPGGGGLGRGAEVWGEPGTGRGGLGRAGAGPVVNFAGGYRLASYRHWLGSRGEPGRLWAAGRTESGKSADQRQNLTGTIYQPEWLNLPSLARLKPNRDCDSRHVAQRDDTSASALDVLLPKSDAAFSREYQSADKLTSSVSVDYTANLRCTYMSSATF